MLLGDSASLTLLQPSCSKTQAMLSGVAQDDQPRLFVSPEHQGGVLLQKPFYVDFVGPGALLDGRIDAGYKAMYSIGTVHLSVAMTLEERSKARQQRLAYSCRLAEIARFYDARRRAIAIVQQMCEWVGEDNAQLMSPDLMGRLVGVFPKTIRAAWLQRAEHCQCQFLASDRRLDELP